MTLELSDLDTIQQNALKKFEERVGGAGNNPGAIERELFRLESQLEQLYSFTDRRGTARTGNGPDG